MTAKIFVTLKPGVLDPQGQAVGGALGRLGFPEVNGVRIGKYIELEIEGGAPPDKASRAALDAKLKKMCESLLANTVIEQFRWSWRNEVRKQALFTGAGAVRIAVLSFPGSNCDDDAVHVARTILGAEAPKVFHKAAELPSGCDAIVLPGGFSYGDYLRSGAMAAHSPIMPAVKRFAEQGGPVLAICNGFQIACEAGLLPGVLTRNEGLTFSCKDVHLVVEGRQTPFTAGIPAGRVLKMPIAHAEGRYVHPDPDALTKAGQVVFRYVEHGGARSAAANPNGSVAAIAGVCNERGNVVGLMPHPERAAEISLGSSDGRQLFEALVGHFAKDGRRVPTMFAGEAR